MMFDVKADKIQTVLILCVASWAYTQWGYIWYATVFDDIWQHLIGRTEEDLIVLAEKRGVIQAILTYVISLVQVLGLYIVQTVSKARTFLQYQSRALVISLFIAGPVLGNEVLFAGSSEKLWILDSLHFMFGYAGISLIFWIWQSSYIRLKPV